jgi:hypothetical protein
LHRRHPAPKTVELRRSAAGRFHDGLDEETDVDEVLDHLDQVSVFGRSALAVVLILGIDLALSLLHSLQEWKGSEVPLWRVFGAIVGIWIPHPLGFASFTLGLTVTLWAVGLMGLAGWLPIAGPIPLCAAIGALGALVGARVADTLVSHWLLYGLGYRPNPGLSSTPLYLTEAAFIGTAFWKGFSLAPQPAWWGFALGCLFFCLVLPALRGLRAVVPSWRRECWARWEPLPAWTKD